jgi:hypothetical protein
VEELRGGGTGGEKQCTLQLERRATSIGSCASCTRGTLDRSPGGASCLTRSTIPPCLRTSTARWPVSSPTCPALSTARSSRCTLPTSGWASARRAVTELVRRAHPGWTELRVIITTNDNLDALRFYQRRGFELVELRAAAVDTTRADLKPSIPTRGYYDLPTGSAPLGSRDRIRA